MTKLKMRDTNSIISDKFRRMIMKKNNEDRFVMGCSMFDTARQIVESSIYNQFPDIKKKELNIKIFLRFYGKDFNEAQRKRILKHLQNTCIS